MDAADEIEDEDDDDFDEEDAADDDADNDNADSDLESKADAEGDDAEDDEDFKYFFGCFFVVFLVISRSSSSLKSDSSSIICFVLEGDFFAVIVVFGAMSSFFFAFVDLIFEVVDFVGVFFLALVLDRISCLADKGIVTMIFVLKTKL